MADDATPAAAPLPVFVYSFDNDRHREQVALWTFYESRQHDHCSHDWAGRPMARKGEGYLAYRMREKGSPLQGGVRSNHDDRRPNVPQGLIPRVINRFTDMTCGRPAAIVTKGDEDSTAAIEALIAKSSMWDALQEMESIGGACRSAAILPVFLDGVASHEVFRPFELYVRDWADRSRWIPREVIHQERVDREVVDEKTKAIQTRTFVRTRLWTETHVYTYKDVDLALYNGEELVLVDEDGELEHGWGRCPIVWHQNIRSTRSPDGELDLLNLGNYELSDNADKVSSHAVKATRANTEPTVVRSDRDIMFQLHPVIAKGVGNEIRTSEVGKVDYLKYDGESVSMAWDTVDRLTLTILRNCNCVVYDVDLALAAHGNGDSGEALMQRSMAMQKRCNRKRVPLERTISQLLDLWRTKMLAAGISSEDEPVEGTVVLPPRCVRQMPEDADEPEEQAELAQDAASDLKAIKQDPGNVLGWSNLERAVERFEPHKLGSGGSLEFRWPPYTELTPMQIQAYLTALSQATGAKRVISQQTGIELASTALGLRDVEGEKKRIAGEEVAGVSRIQRQAEAMLAPDTSEDGGDTAADEAERAGADAADGDPAGSGQPPPPGGKPPA